MVRKQKTMTRKEQIEYAIRNLKINKDKLDFFIKVEDSNQSQRCSLDVLAYQLLSEYLLEGDNDDLSTNKHI